MGYNSKHNVRSNFPSTYEALKAFLTSGRKKDSREIGNNTIAYCDSNNLINVRYYQSTIAYFYSNGKIELTLAGYNTKSTRQRINSFLPEGFHVYQSNHKAVMFNANETFALDDVITIEDKVLYFMSNGKKVVLPI